MAYFTCPVALLH